MDIELTRLMMSLSFFVLLGLWNVVIFVSYIICTQRDLCIGKAFGGPIEFIGNFR